MAGKNFSITGLDKIAKPNPVPENAPKLTSPLLSESDVIKAAGAGKAQIIGGSDPGFVDAATRPKSSAGSGLLGGISQAVSSAGSALTETVKPVSQVSQTAVQAVTPVLEAAVETVKAPVQAVQEITKIDVPKLQ